MRKKQEKSIWQIYGATGGVDPKYDDPTVFGSKIVDYFKQKDEANKPISLPGLALHLGFASRQSLYDYEKKGGGFAYWIKRARLVIETAIAENEGNMNDALRIFMLKNMGYTDKTELKIKGTSFKIKIDEK